MGDLSVLHLFVLLLNHLLSFLDLGDQVGICRLNTLALLKHFVLFPYCLLVGLDLLVQVVNLLLVLLELLLLLLPLVLNLLLKLVDLVG